MDFYKIKERSTKKDTVEVYPVFHIGRSKDIMIRGKSFYAIWDPVKNMWSTDEYDVQRIVDTDLIKYKDEVEKRTDCKVRIKSLQDFSTNSWTDFKRYLASVSDNIVQLDNRIIFQNQEVKRNDYCSKKLSYPLVEGECPAYDKIMSTLYDEKEREKIEWAIGSIIHGDAKKIQKFLVFYGEGGTGKSTVLNIVQKLFEGYCSTFDAKALTNSNDSFAMEPFKTNPLVAIQHDGDLSRIEDNTRLNSIVSHEDMTVNEKFKPKYTMKVNCMLLMGTNKPVKITDAKSGIIRRLIDVSPTGKKIPPSEYYELIEKIDYELGAIAYHCLNIYKKLGKSYYATYKPIDMMLKTDIFFNFIEEYYDDFKKEDGVSLKRSYDMYKQYCSDTCLDHVMPRHRFRDEIKNYFQEFHDRIRIDGVSQRSYYKGFIDTKIDLTTEEVKEKNSLTLHSDSILLDVMLADCKAQYTTRKETPINKWAEVKTYLRDLNTTELHYVKPPENHIVIDFDIKDNNGNKSLDLNLEAASKWPETYAEASKSGNGIHLHYIYAGDVSRLSRVHSEGIEIKIFNGDSSLRRKRIKNNNVPVATISSGLPLKGEKMVKFEILQNEKSLRRLIAKNLRKEIHPGTKPSIDFIHKILEDAYDSDIYYDLTDMRPLVLVFANNSSNQSEYCINLVNEMKFKSAKENDDKSVYDDKESIVFYDVEVFPNLFIVCWKKRGKGNKIVRMINPCPKQIEKLMNLKLVGFNNRRYDNHILYGRYMGFDNTQLYNLSQRIINNSPNAMFGEAYNLSYTDIYCFSSKKQSLKKFEIELGLHHDELGLPWDEPVPKELWERAAEYCDNDVLATEAVFEARQEDFMARQILSELSGLTVNDTTQKHTAKIIFGNDKRPQEKFIYTDLSEMFPGYKYEFGKSTYRGEEVGEGGYVHGEPGIYVNAALIDVKSMHPNSLIQLNAFGKEYTFRFKELVDARLAVKEKRYNDARKILDGLLIPFLDDESKIGGLAYSLKIVINIVYGMTSAKFDNPFKDPRNVDNIVAKRGALFMMDLKYAIQAKGYTVLHVKTDSVKIANADDNIIQFVHDFGKKYGYEFDHEATYEKIALVNDAVYIAKDSSDGHWTATGAQFAHPYIFKTLFTKEKLEFKDLIETKSVTGKLYLDMNEGYEDVSYYENVKKLREKRTDQLRNKDVDILEDTNYIDGEELDRLIAKGHNYKFIGKVGAFIPIKPGYGGGILYREKDGKYYAATGTKGYRWMEAEMVKKLGKENDIDYGYYEDLANKAIDNISKYGDFEWFRE